MLIPILKVFLIIVTVICSFMLIAVILLQKAKGEGLGLAFGAQMGESLFGARASNVLVRITVWLGVIFLVCTTFLARIYAEGYNRSLMERQAPVKQGPMPVLPGTPAPTQLPVSRSVMPEAQPAPVSDPAGASMPVPAIPAMPSEPAAPFSAPESQPVE